MDPARFPAKAPVSALFLGLLLVSGSRPLHAQELRLSDVFTSATLATPLLTLADLQRDGAQAAVVWQSLEDQLGAGATEDALRQADLLWAWYPQKSPESGRVLHARGRILKAAGRRENLIQLARQYLADFPTGEHRGWFLIEMAEAASAQGNPQTATQLWLSAQEARAAFPPAAALAAAQDFLRTGRATDARTLLLGLPPSAEVQEALLESLLLEDDPALAPPPAETPRARLRLCLLWELRRRHGEARALKAALLTAPGDLTTKELELLALVDRQPSPGNEAPAPSPPEG